MSSSILSVVQPGLQTTLQDEGRASYSSLGIARCGALDPNALSVANLLAGNNQNHAAIEISVGPFEISVNRPTVFGVCGQGFQLSVTGRNGKPNEIYSNRSLLLEAGDSLLAKNTADSGRLYIAVAGGFDIDPVLGSTSTDLYAKFGGFCGRSLQRGDNLPCQSAKYNTGNAHQLRIAAPNFRVRAIEGPEYNLLSDDSKQRFWQTRWQLDSNSNRMAARLKAQPLRFEQSTAPDLLSHAVLPGVIQLPQAGLPMVLLADAQTTGGYPRIASVIEADLWQFAQMPTGSYFTFTQCNRIDAFNAQQYRNQMLERLKLAIKLARLKQLGHDE